MRGDHCNMHPAEVMGKKTSPCGRTDKAVDVEDHGNGFMFVGCSDLKQAGRLLGEYVDNPEDYRFAARVLQRLPGDRLACGVWLAAEPDANWDGSVDMYGEPLPR